MPHAACRMPKRRMSAHTRAFNDIMTSLLEELSRVKTCEYTAEDVRVFEELHEEIRVLKKERNAGIVAHNYYRPEILKIAAFVGDSLEIALLAATVKAAAVIEFCGVHLMAETPKLVNS